jgi:hypothetical protein
VATGSARGLSRTVWGRLAIVAVFAIAMAYMEAAVVVYLRAVFHLAGDLMTLPPAPQSIWFSVPFFTLLKPGALLSVLPQQAIASTEVAREAATIVMLACVGWLAGSKLKSRFAYFIFAFGVWDIGYYAFLRVLAGWPASLGDMDVLFLIPGPWLAPVFVPVAISVAMIVGAAWMLRGTSRG